MRLDPFRLVQEWTYGQFKLAMECLEDEAAIQKEEMEQAQREAKTKRSGGRSFTTYNRKQR